MPKTVLVVDDDAVFRTMIGDGLRAAGYRVGVAADGLEALEQVRKAPPDFILLDLIMPRLDGFRVCKVLKSDPRHQGIPVVVLTGLGKEAVKNLQEIGAEVAVAKRGAEATLTEVLKTLRLLGSARLKPVPLPESVQDLEERRIVSELLAERQHTQTVLANLGEGVVELDDRGRVVYLNPAALRMLDRGEAETLGAPGADLLGSANAPALQQALGDVRQGGEGHPMHLDLVLGTRTLGVTLTAFQRAESPSGVLLVLRDLTDLVSRTENLRRSLQALEAVGRHILGKLDLPSLFREIVARTADILGAQGCGLFAGQRVDGHLRIRCVAAVGLSDRFRREFDIAPGEGEVGKAMAARRPVWTADLLGDAALQVPAALRALVQEEGLPAILAAPILFPDEAFGALSVYRPAGHQFVPEEVALVTSLADAVAIAIENARLLRQEQDRRRQLEAVRAVGEEITREMDLPTLLGLIHHRAAELGGAKAGAVWLWDEAAQVLAPEAWHGRGDWMREARLGLGEGVAGTVAQRREGMIVDDYQASPYASPRLRERISATAVLAEPLLYRDRLLGVILIDNEGTGQPFTPQDRETMALFATQAAIAIENARLYAEIRKAYEDLRAAQEQLVEGEKLRALGVMASGVAHDFNNRLAIILAQAEALGMRYADPALREALNVVQQAALDGGATVRRFLDFTRVQAQSGDAPVDPAESIQQVLEMTRPRWKDEAQERGVAIEANVEMEPVPPVLGEAFALREALVHLVFNAVDAMPQGGRLTLGARRVAGAAGAAEGGGGDFVDVFVRDTGLGMPEAVRRRAFDPFFTTKGVRSSGLGLSAVYGIVTRQGGEVRLESQEGRGTTVTVRLPAAPAGAAQAAPAPAPEAAPPPSPPRAGRILVLDDEDQLAEILADLLRLRGHAVDVFTDPRLALEHLARTPADLLFTDLGMPGMSGWEVARKARQLRPGLPVVLVTGWAHMVDPAEARAHGLDAVVAKPFNAQELVRVMAQCLGAPAPG